MLPVLTEILLYVFVLVNMDRIKNCTELFFFKFVCLLYIIKIVRPIFFFILYGYYR